MQRKHPYTDYIRRLVDDAPPLSEAQRSRIATIFRPVITRTAPSQRREAKAA